jgi:hypothetical protein
MKTVRRIALFLISIHGVIAQTGGIPKFDVASVKLAAAGGRGGLIYPIGGGVRVTNMAIFAQRPKRVTFW